MPSLLKRGRFKSSAGTFGPGQSKVNNCSKDTKKIEANDTQLAHSRCHCCGTILHHPSNVPKFKCAVCQVTVRMVRETSGSSNSDGNAKLASLLELQKVVDACHLNSLGNCSKKERLQAAEPVVAYLSAAFGSAYILEESFVSRRKHDLIDYQELSEFYELVTNLPTRRPLRKMLTACDKLLKTYHGTLEKFRWILIIWFCPTLRQSLTSRFKLDPDSSQIRSLSYEIAKRCIGYLSNLPRGSSSNKFVKYLKHMSLELFQNDVETVNLYITSQMSRIFCRTGAVSQCSDHALTRSYDENGRGRSQENLQELCSSVVAAPRDAAFRLHDYECDWHLSSAAKLMMFFHAANCKRSNAERDSRLASSTFYNMMFDFIEFKQDFNRWRYRDRTTEGLLRKIARFEREESSFCLCQYPFLLSLGVKNAIMSLESRQVMGNETENAFLTSLNEKKDVAMSFQISVRRDHLESDSLRCIQMGRKDLLKSMEVKFVNEPGVDAGGPRREWFFLLTRSLLCPERNLFLNVEESGFLWFVFEPLSSRRHETDRLLFLLGVVIGLAVFHNVILDLWFPSCFYKGLCGESLTTADYMEVFPESGRNLIKMLDYNKEDFTDIFGLTFEVTMKTGPSNDTDISRTCTEELAPRGKYKQVTQENKKEFVRSWIDFHMNIAVGRQFRQIATGFHQVFSKSEAIKLFDHEELQRLICGCREKGIYDLEMLRSMATYTGGFTDNCEIIEWFWDILKEWDDLTTKKLFIFVTGSDRVPPTGIYTLAIRISRSGRGDSENLPVAHTCFNELCLSEYSTKEKLEKKLRMAVTQSEGFGLK